MHEGIIEINEIENRETLSDRNTSLAARFVRYPGSQQLIVWLPASGFTYSGNYLIANSKNTIDHNTVQSKLNGSTQLVFYTIEWPAGDYYLQIDIPTGGTHVMKFKKWEENELVPKDQIMEMPVAYAGQPSLIKKTLPDNDEIEIPQEDSLWKIYKDGTGKPIPNEDRMIRAMADEKMVETFRNLLITKGPSLEYEGNFRSGYVIYVDGDNRIKFYHEMGGGDCKMYVDIPTSEKWEQDTKLPLHKRREILLFVASTIQKEQANSWRFEIRDDMIYFY